MFRNWKKKKTSQQISRKRRGKTKNMTQM